MHDYTILSYAVWRESESNYVLIVVISDAFVSFDKSEATAARRRGRVSAACVCVGRRDHLFASRIFLHTKCRGEFSDDGEWDESVCGLRALTFTATRAGML
jgi:hypothetical protein